MDLRKIINEIQNTPFTQTELQVIIDCAKRERQKHTHPSDNYKVGDIVVFSSNARPHYLVGRRARIKRVLRKRLQIEMIDPVRKFRGVVTTPTTIIEYITERDDSEIKSILSQMPIEESIYIPTL